MPGPISDEDKIKIRTRDCEMSSYLAIWIPEAVFKAQITSAPDVAEPSITTLAIGIPSLGDYSDVEADMTVYVGSSDGDFNHGIFRARSAIAGTLTIGETSDFKFIADDDYVTVLQDWRPWAKFPYIDPNTNVIYKDRDVAWTGYPQAMKPKANAGPDWAVATIDEEDGYATVYFVDEDSFGIAPSASVSLYTWDTTGGDPASQSQAAASTAAVPYEVHYDTAGQYIAKLTVTDSNSQTGLMRVKVKIFDAENPPYTDFDWKRTGNYEQGGHRAAITVRGDDISESEFPTGAAVCIFVKERHGTDVGSYGEYPHRADIKFCGWIVRDDEVRRPQLADKAGEVMFTAEGIEGIMRRIHALGTYLQYSTGPINWTEMLTMNTTRAATHLIQWHSTICEIVHIQASNMDELIELQSFPEGPLYETIDAFARQAFGRLLASKQNVMYLEKNVQLMLTATRATIGPPVFDIGEQDWAETLTIPKAQLSSVSTLEINGIYWSGHDVTPVIALAPGPVPMWRGIEQGPQTGYIFQSSEGVFQVGHSLALLNNPYPSIPVAMDKGYDFVDFAPREYFTLVSGTLKRGPEFDGGSKFLLNELSAEVDNRNQTMDVIWTLEAESIGAPGIPVDVPTQPEPPEPVPPEEPEPPPEPPEPPPVPEGDVETMYVAVYDWAPFETIDHGVTWEDIS